MTENTTEELPPQVFQDDMHKMQFDVLSGMIAKRNELVGRYNAASGSREGLVEQVRESDDPRINDLREEWSRAYLALMEVVDPIVDEIINNSQGNQDELEKDIKELDQKLKPGVTYFKKMYGENAAKYFPTQNRVAGTIRAGGSGKRVRGFDVEVTIDGETKKFDNAAGAAKHIGGDIETSDLQKGFFEKAKVDASKDAPDTVSFTVEFDEVDADNNKTTKEAFVKFTRVTTTSAPTETASDSAETSEPADDATDEATPEADDDSDLANF